MSQKKINKIKGSTVKPIKDPVTTPIIDKEKEPNQDILQDWIPFFQDSNNIYVNDLAKRARRSSTHSSIINQKITFGVGKEFLFKVDGEEKAFEELDKNFKEWYMGVNPEGDTLRDVFKELMQSFVITGNCYPHVKKVGSYTALYSEDATTVRKSKDKKRAYISNFWRDILNNNTSTSQYPINSKLTFYDGSPKSEYLLHIMRKYPEFNYYGLPDYVGALNWIDIEYRIPKYNIDKFDNGFFPSVLMQMFGEVPDGMNAQEYVNKIKDTYVGEGKNDKILIELLDSPEQAAVIQQLENEREGEFLTLSNLSEKAIIVAHRITPSLAGLETAGKLGSNQQTKDEYDKFMNSVIIPDYQEPLLRAINRIISKDTNFNVEVSILNVAPVGNSASIDINAVTTINEGREMLGMNPLEDNVRGDDFINQNSVGNIETTEDKEKEEDGV